MAQRDQPNGYGARRFVRMLPALMIVGAVAFDALTPKGFTASPMFAAAPLIAAPFFSWLTTLLTGIAATLGVIGLHIYKDTVYASTSYTETVTVITVSGLALLINRVIQRSSERLASARVIAETAQRAVLPTPAERIGGLRIAARYEAAIADAFIGGDLFAVQDTSHGVRLVVGDVRGKGLGAVEAVAVAIGAFREAAEMERSLVDVAARLERSMIREAQRRDTLDAEEGFTTAVLAEIPHGAGVVRLVNRGHPEPLLLFGDGSLVVLAPSTPALPLGLVDIATWPDRAEEYPLPPGATLLLYTDGLSEARDARGVFYDPAAWLIGRSFAGPGELLDVLVEDVRRHTGGGATDDMALLAVARPSEEGSEGPPGPAAESAAGPAAEVSPESAPEVSPEGSPEVSPEVSVEGAPGQAPRRREGPDPGAHAEATRCS
ncbi:PP2C family protein-serine/threonine phosphatase [Streptomyces sp. NPDC020965]|uniref:PP2C family protein-serine/threonine phosphatase n=1 Tax=Streptomyces sp. NPDC020965 TaxID=3365105 RepID=UPI0037BAB1A5